jgi:RimJ/RimL family protein N-acetyltransferase
MRLPPILQTNRCVLRQAAPDDYSALVANIEAPEFPAALPLALMHREGKLRVWFESMLSKSAEGKAHVLSIELRGESRCIGQVSLTPVNDSASWNLAFWLQPAYWGKGLALETTQAALDYFFNELALSNIVAGAAGWNVRSVQLLEKLGAKLQVADSAVSPGSHASEAFKKFSIPFEAYKRIASN